MSRSIAPLFTVVLAAVLLLAGLAQAQDGRNPRRPDRQPQQRGERGPQRGGQQMFTVDPDKDPVLKTIRAAVEPTDEQMDVITAAFIKLRADQEKAFTEFRAAQMSQRGERGPRGEPGARGQQGKRGQRGESDARREHGERGDGNGRAQREQMMQKLNAAFEPLNAQFMADCRVILNDDQHAAWNACAADLNLSPMRSRQARDAGGPAVGDAAPDFNILTTTGDAVKLKSLLDKPTVIEFASYTCPIFRSKIDKMAALREQFGDRINYIIIYTKEAHASDGRRPVQRNTDAGIDIHQHTSFQQRLQAAQRMQSDLDLNVTILVDSFDDDVTNAYNGHPNRGYVIDLDGKVRSRQVWIDADATRKTLETLLKTEAASASPAGEI